VNRAKKKKKNDQGQVARREKKKCSRTSTGGRKGEKVLRTIRVQESPPSLTAKVKKAIKLKGSEKRKKRNHGVLC